MDEAIRQIRIEGNIAYVPLTRGYEAVIDKDDIDLVSGKNWHAIVTPWTVYAARKNKKEGSKSMHSVIFGPLPNGMEIDHIDCNGLNNMKSNLRAASKSQNQRNKKIQKNNSSGFKGVSFDKKNKKWIAFISVKKRAINLGRYRTPDLAHEAYKNAAMRLYGDFARFE